MNYETTGLTKLTNPANALVAHTNRSWTDRDGDWVPDCDLTNPLESGECGPYLNRNFGTAVITTRYAQDVTEGWQVRPWNKQISAVVQHEVMPGFGLTVGYFRTLVRQQDRHGQSRRDECGLHGVLRHGACATRVCRTAADTRSAATTTSIRAARASSTTW